MGLEPHGISIKSITCSTSMSEDVNSVDRRSRPSLQRTNGQRFRVLDSRTCPLSAYYDDGGSGGGSSGSRTYGMNRSNSNYIRNRDREERAMQRLKEMQSHLERASHYATNGPHTEEIEDEEEMVELMSIVSSLQDSNGEKEDIILQLQQRLSQVEDELYSQRRAMKVEIKSWKQKHSRMEKENYRLIEKMAAKAGEQQRTMKDAGYWEEKYDELVQKVGDLSNDNGDLLAKVHRLEEDGAKHEENLAIMEEVQAENESLYQSMEEAMGLVSGMSNKLAEFSRMHEETVRNYEEKLTKLKGELEGPSGGMARYTLERENRKLLAKVAELKAENEEGYQTCEILQREIDMLRGPQKQAAGNTSNERHQRDEGARPALSTIIEEEDASQMYEDQTL